MDDVKGRLRRWAVPGLPFLFSLALSIPTAGTTVFWQDSGFFLTAVHDLAVPASPGFILYLLLAKVWTTLVAPVVGFTLAVHLFSSFCAAGAAAFLSLAARGFLRRFQPDGPSDGPAIAASCLSAAGYCFWNASTLAKPYALYYLTLAVLLWILVRAERRADFLWMGVMLGLAWAAHPSAAMLVPAMLAYAAARRDKVRLLGASGFAGVIAIAAACAFVPSFVGLPMLSARDSLISFGDPRTPAQVWTHLRGAHYTDFKGAWGFDFPRALLAGRFIWEEFLGIGLGVLGLGLWRLGKERAGVLGLIGAWAVPMLLLPLVFIGEGMFDQWFVAAYLPLAFCTATGFAWLARWGKAALPASAAAALAWMVLANYADLNFRSYDLAEIYGRLLLKNLEPGAVLVANTDDATVIPIYLQQVRGVRPDVRVIHGEFLGLEWYDPRIERAYGLKPPQTAEIAGRTNPQLLYVTAFANANVSPQHPVYSERPPDPRGLRPGLVQVPAGMLWKTTVAEEAGINPRYWDLPVDPFAVARQRRRARGIFMRHTSAGMVARFEPYEERLIGILVQAKLRQTESLLGHDPAQALAIYEKAREIDSTLEVDAAFQYNYGLALYLRDQFAPAREAFQKVLLLEPQPGRETLSHFYLAEIARAARHMDEAKAHYQRALEINGADPIQMTNIRIRAGQP